ncbi:MAG: hypothetical protein QNK84_10005 [Flavobacteriales bacterium]|jgi:hypothetical protein|tara:strand:- start:7980 stop:8381 length:402 start_codon:yes stop_codon:yes gene_type:complete
MESIDGNKLIVKLQKGLAKDGLKMDAIVKGLKELRPYALEEKDPTLTKVTRLTYEHIEANKTFNIPLPPEEAIAPELEEGEIAPEEVEMILSTIESDDDRLESLDYLFSLMLDRENEDNIQDMFAYRDALKGY